MSYHSGINQKVLEQEFFTNTTAMDQAVNEPNGSLLANLTYVRNYFASVIANFLPVNNPNFTGSLSSSSGGNINLINPSSYLKVPIISGVSTFTSQPLIYYGSSIGTFPIETRVIGEIKMVMSLTTPPNYLPCDGASLNTITYNTLFSVIGYAYGGFENNFNLPNFQGLFPVGANGVYDDVPASNLSTGFNTTGATNTFNNQAYFGGSAVSVAPILNKVPPHTHNIYDNGHTHNTAITPSTESTITPLGVQVYMYPDSTFVTTTSKGYTGIVIEGTGSNIQQIDPISNLSGVNITPPYIAVNYFICYQ